MPRVNEPVEYNCDQVRANLIACMLNDLSIIDALKHNNAFV